MNRIEDQISESESNLECIEERNAGGTCESFLERVSRAGKAGVSRLAAGVSHLKEMSGKFNDMVTDVTMLLVAIAIKNILFPILFLLGAVKCSLPMARHASRLLSGFERDFEKAERHDEAAEGSSATIGTTRIATVMLFVRCQYGLPSRWRREIVVPWTANSVHVRQAAARAGG